MRRIITITCTLLLCLATHAQRITASFQGTPLPDVLERLNILQDEYDICAINNELEEFIITADIKDATLHEALAQIVAYYPIRISTKGRTVYVEALSKQLVQYRGVVVGRDSVPLSYATVTLYNPIDTTLLRQAACSNAGVFVVPCPEDSVLARFTHVAHDTLWIKTLQSNLGVVEMHERDKNLNPMKVDGEDGRTSWNMAPQTVVEVKKAGTLSDMLTKEQQDTCTSLIIEGKLNSQDIRLLRHMAGYRENGCPTGRLELLDLRNAQFVTDRNPYMILDAAAEHMMCYTKVGRDNSPHANNLVVYEPRYAHELRTPDKSSGNTVGGLFKESYKGSYPKTTTRAYYYLNFHSDTDNEGEWIDAKRSSCLVTFADKDEVSWSSIKQNMLQKTAGHFLTNQNGAYLWNAHTKKGYIAGDMFHKCPHLKEVIIPRRTKWADNIQVIDNPIHYQRPAEDQFLNNLEKFNKKK